MSIQVSCPKCRKTYALKDDSRGKPVRCKQCQTVFTADPAAPEPEVVADIVEEEEPTPEPASKPMRKEKPASKQPKMSTGLKIAAVAAGILWVFSCCGGASLAGYYFFGKGGKSAIGGGPLDGTYKVMAAHALGQPVPADRISSMYSDYVIRGNTISYKLQGTPIEATFTLNPNANPATMDLTADGRTTYCIYKLEGDTLTLCMGLDASSRPKEFNASDALGMIVLKRR